MSDFFSDPVMFLVTLGGVGALAVLVWRTREYWLLPVMVTLGWIAFYYGVAAFGVLPYASDGAWRLSIFRPAFFLFVLFAVIALWCALTTRSPT